MTYKTHSELFAAVARVCKIAEENGIDDPFEGSWKYQGDLLSEELEGEWLFKSPEAKDEYEFAIGLVEGKWVFEGDELYEYDGTTSIVRGKHFPLNALSWNPPKPRTVMVEMLREDALFGADEFDKHGATVHRLHRIYEACKKALDKDNA